MKRSASFFLTALLLAPLAALHAADAPKPASKPNIVIILADDMGYGDPHCFNPQSKIATPHIDRLAKEGMRFTDAHAPGPLCHPSRYGRMPNNISEEMSRMMSTRAGPAARRGAWWMTSRTSWTSHRPSWKSAA